MVLNIFQVDAFTNQIFAGNPAAVCPLDDWYTDKTLQRIAQENAVSETAFIKGENGHYTIRWFTPEIEMDLCGHATLAAAHVIKHHLNDKAKSILFTSNSGDLVVTPDGSTFNLDFPSRPPFPAEAPQAVLEALSIAPVNVLKSRDYVLIYENEAQIKQLEVNKNVLDRINLDPGGVVVTAPGQDVDFVSRFFTPQASILEDPVTGSSHCSLIPFWAAKLNKPVLMAKQLSKREGTLYCKYQGDRVIISGQAVTYMTGTINLDTAIV